MDDKWDRLAKLFVRATQTGRFFETCSNHKLSLILEKMIGYHVGMFSDSDSLITEVVKRLQNSDG